MNIQHTTDKQQIPSHPVDFEWVCNECDFRNFTTSVSEQEIEEELWSCINCGGFEFHKKPKTEK